MMETIETIKWLAEFSVIVIVGLAAVAKTLRDKDELDLMKTLEAAADAADRVKSKLEEGEEKGIKIDELVENAVDKVEKIRGKKLPKKLRRKARERIKTMVPWDFDQDVKE